MNKQELRNLVVEVLTDYNDNFIGKPCDEIVEEVLSHLEGVQADRYQMMVLIGGLVEELYE